MEDMIDVKPAPAPEPASETAVKEEIKEVRANEVATISPKRKKEM